MDNQSNPALENLEIEQATLGAILYSPSPLVEVFRILSLDDFSQPNHRKIFQVMLELHNRGMPIDLTTVTAFLKDEDKLDEVGGAIFLAGLHENVGTAANVEYYAKLVLEYSIKRNLALLGRRLPIEVGKGSSVEDLLTFAESQFADLAKKYHSANGANPLISSICDASKFIGLNFPPKRVYINPWLREAQIIMICGNRGIGKTQVGVSLVSSITSGKPFGPWEVITPVPCLYLDGEMAVPDLQGRFKQFLRGDPKEHLLIYSDAHMNYLGLPRANLLNAEWRAQMKELLLAEGVKLWVVDNLASLCHGLDQNSQAEWSPINEFFLELRFAGLTTIFMHHTNRTGGQRGTSAREDNLDLSIMLERPANYRTEEGTRFVWKFEKTRLPQKDLNLLGDTEFQLEPTPEGSQIWTFRNVRQDNKSKVIKMLDEGMSQKDIAKELKITESRVSQIKGEAIKQGFLSEEGKLTQAGLEKLNL